MVRIYTIIRLLHARRSDDAPRGLVLKWRMRLPTWIGARSLKLVTSRRT